MCLAAFQILWIFLPHSGLGSIPVVCLLGYLEILYNTRRLYIDIETCERLQT